MLRARCAALLLAATLVLVSGCLCCRRSCLGRTNGEEVVASGCCEGAGAPVFEQPFVAGGTVVPSVPPGYVAPGQPPTANGMPRLAPVPQTPAPVYPFTPQSRIKTSSRGDLELVQ